MRFGGTCSLFVPHRWGCVQVLVLNVVLSMLCAPLSGQGDVPIRRSSARM
ncbi:MAG: hypothetical protein ACLVJ6_05455 [Merdibacter sp.]